MDRHLQRIAPTLLALAMPFAGWAATAAERTNQFETVTLLIEKEYRLPAKRQIEDWAKAGLPDEGGWYAKYLQFAYADRFRVSSPDAAEKAQLEAAAKSLSAELEAAKKAGKLPPDIASKIGGTGQVVRLVNDLFRVMNFGAPPPMLKAQAFSDEQKAASNAAVKAIIGLAEAEFASNAAQVAANKKDEDEFWNLDEKNPRFALINEKAITLRLEAVKPVYFAHMILREVADRGADFGIDPAPAKAWLESFIRKNYTVIQDWDYNWGENHAFLHAFDMNLICEAARWKVKGAATEDIETELFKTIEMDLEKEFKDAGTRDEIRTLQAKAWAQVFNWYREIGDEKSLARGAELWGDFLRKQKEAKNGGFRLDDRNASRAEEIGRIYLAASRLMVAKGDKAGSIGILQQLAGQKSNPMAVVASEWVKFNMVSDKEGGSSGSGWGTQPAAEDPEIALGTGKAFLNTAQGIADAAQARAFRVNAAVALRNGALGLSNDAYKDKADQFAPELWYRYAFALNQLELRWHAAVAAQQGMKALLRRLGDGKAANPWRGKDGQWNESGRYAQALARNAITYGSNLLRNSKGTGTNQLNDELITLVGKLSPEDTGPGLEKIQIISRLDEKDYEGATEATLTFLKKYDALYVDGAQLLLQCYQRKLGDKKVSPEAKKTASDALLKFAAEGTKRVDAEVAKLKDTAAKRPWESLRSALGSAEIPVWLEQGRFEDVLKRLDANFWKNPPSDEELSARLVYSMCTATKEWYQARIKDDKAKLDSALLLAAWPQVNDAYETWKLQKVRLPSQESRLGGAGRTLAFIFNTIDRQAEAMRSQANAPAALKDIQATAKRAFADLVEPDTNERSKPDNVLGIAGVLWDIGDHQRAARLYAIYLKQVGADSDIAGLWEQPKALLDPIDGPLSGRPELKKQWVLVRDLLEDAPDLVKKLIDGLDPDKAGEQKRDFGRAAEAIDKLMVEVAKQKSVLGAEYQKVDEGLKKIRGLCVQQIRRIGTMTNLAQCAREMGDKAKANELYQQLINYDPLNLVYISAMVEITIDRIKAGEQVSKEDAERAQQLAVKVREGAGPNDRDSYWTAVIQIMEIAAFLGDTQPIVKRLKFDATNQSTPADDLQQFPRPKADDKHVRRARNVLARQLCERYLQLFQHVKDVPKSFRIDQVELDGKPLSIFVPLEGPKFTGLSRLEDGGITTWYIWEEGKPPPAEEPKKDAPAPVPAPAPAPEAKKDAAPAPAPAEPQPAEAPKKEAK